jgi:hypothetical protein
MAIASAYADEVVGMGVVALPDVVVDASVGRLEAVVLLDAASGLSGTCAGTVAEV